MNNSIKRADCLNTIRLLGAIQVLYGHALAHLHIEPLPVAGDFINFFYGVPIFFTLSGFLIWESCGRSANYTDYLKKRFWRIYPELWIAVAVEMVVLFSLYAGPYNWVQTTLFVFTQSTILQFWTPDCLRGYGCGTPNGALWTIGVLVQFYIVAYLLYRWLHGKGLLKWILGGGNSFISHWGVVTCHHRADARDNREVVWTNTTTIPLDVHNSLHDCRV